MSDVFLSYSRKDTDIMQRVRDDLRAAGLTVWTDENLKPGTSDWEAAIQQEISATNSLVVLLSPDANNSEWVGRELARAEDFFVRIYPLLTRGDAQNAIPVRLAKHQRHDLRDDNKYEKVISELVTSISQFIRTKKTVTEILQQIEFDMPEAQISDLFALAEQATTGYEELLKRVNQHRQRWQNEVGKQEQEYQQVEESVSRYLKYITTGTISWRRTDDLLRKAEQAARAYPDLAYKVRRKRTSTYKIHAEVFQKILSQIDELLKASHVDESEIRQLLTEAEHHAVDIQALEAKRYLVERVLGSGPLSESVPVTIANSPSATPSLDVVPTPASSGEVTIQSTVIRRISRRRLITTILVVVAIAALILIVRFSNILDTRTTPPPLDATNLDAVVTSTLNYKATVDKQNTQTAIARTATALAPTTPTSTPTPTLTDTPTLDYKATVDEQNTQTAVARTAAAAAP